MMATFKGRIPFTPFCMDDFSAGCLSSFASSSPLSSCCPLLFFLSHLHADHTRGLSPSWHHGRIVTSAVNAALLPTLYPGFNCGLLLPLPFSCPTRLPLSPHRAEPSFTVTLVPVSHCPGAAAFVLDGYWGRVVYTGDMRWTGGGCCASPFGSRAVDALYLDNTYGSSSRSSRGGCDGFLSRAQAVAAVCRTVRQHSGASQVWLNGDRLGKEDVCVLAARRLRCLVTVEQDKYRLLHALHAIGYDLQHCDTAGRPAAADDEVEQEADEDEEEEEEEAAAAADAAALSAGRWFSYFTTDAAESFFHVRAKRHVTAALLQQANAAMGRRGGEQPAVIAIVMTGWARGAAAAASASATSSAALPASGGCCRCPSCPLHPVVYSSHSSYSELSALLSVVRPRSILPISAPSSPSEPLYSAFLDPSPPAALCIPSALTAPLLPPSAAAGGSSSSSSSSSARAQQRSPFYCRQRSAVKRSRARAFALENADSAVARRGLPGLRLQQTEQLRDDAEEDERELDDAADGEDDAAAAAAVRRFSLPVDGSRSRFACRLSLSSHYSIV